MARTGISRTNQKGRRQDGKLKKSSPGALGNLEPMGRNRASKKEAHRLFVEGGFALQNECRGERTARNARGISLSVLNDCFDDTASDQMGKAKLRGEGRHVCRLKRPSGPSSRRSG